MITPRVWRRLASYCLLVGAFTGGSGCMAYLHPIDSAKIEHTAACLTLPVGCREHVYVFFVHGMDPLNYANMTGVRDYVNELGFGKTYLGQMYHAAYFNREIHRIAGEDPEARFVLIGFSFGANLVRDLAIAARKDDIPVDLLIYLGGNTLENTEKDQPENVGKIVNILATGLIWHGDALDRAENIQLPDVWHFGSPSHEQTLNTMARELAEVASRVTIVEQSLPPLNEEQAPTPRPLPATKTSLNTEWDFLKAPTHLDMVPFGKKTKP